MSNPGAITGRRPIRRALISVYDKTGLVELAQGLHKAGVALVSTGSTAARIAEAGVPVTAVEELTGFPECLDGRVKTLHPRVHAGLLADLRLPEHARQLAELGIEPFDLLVSNLYPFQQTVAAGASFDETVEQIDIGGPSMVRGAAKNHASVAVVTDPAEYPELLAAVDAGGFTGAQRRRLALAAFRHTAAYDVAIATWLAEPGPAGLGSGAGPASAAGLASGAGESQDGASAATPEWLGATWRRHAVLRYGENPHQGAALYRVDGLAAGSGVAAGEQLHGKEMSYNNYVDADAAWRAAHDHDQPAVAIIKHANPCGIAIGADLAEAHRRALVCDPVSAYGGVVAANRPVDAATAAQIAEVFTEVVAAPGFEPAALEVLTRKKNLRLVVVPAGAVAPRELRPIGGGLLVQDVDRVGRVAGDDPASWQLATGAAVDDATLADLAFAWRAVRAVKSNAILLARDGASVGVGMGQVNRVDSCRLAVERAGADRARGAVAASDAFFPFADGLEVLLTAGVRAIVQPGGSVRDAEVTAAAQEAGVAMFLTGTRHFAH